MTKNDGGPAFPLCVSGVAGIQNFNLGMSLRDWFAGQALTGLLAGGPHDYDQIGIEYDAYVHADAMLAAREESGNG